MGVNVKNKKYLKPALFVALVLTVLIYVASSFIFRGDIKITVHNDTFSEQSIWLSPEEEQIYIIPPGEKRNIKYSTEEISISLMLNYHDIEGKPKSIMLSEYVEAHEQGTVIVEMKQLNPNEEIVLEISDKIK